MHDSATLLEPVRRALCIISSNTCSNQERKDAEALFSSFRSHKSALVWAVQLLQQQASWQQQDLAVFAAQTIRYRICEDGHALDQQQRYQLRHLLLGHLTNRPAVATAAFLRQVCLSLAALAAVDPSYDAVSDLSSLRIPLDNTVMLLQLLAEEGCSDWRHVMIPGVSGSKQLDWATEIRERFRSWSPSVLQLLHSWLQEHKDSTQLLVTLLRCLTAWVQFGALHAVAEEVAEQTAQIGLACIQSSVDEVVSAGLDLLLELPEYAPEQLLQSLTPHMVAVAQAACQAAAGGSTAERVHAAAWVKAFTAYAAARPQELLQPLDATHGASLRDALLQVSILPQLSPAGFLCLPALELWASLLEADTLPWGNSSSQHTEQAGNEAKGVEVLSEGDNPGDPAHRVPSLAFVRSCLLLLLHTAASWLSWQQDAACLDALGDGTVILAVQEVLQLACSVLGPERYIAAVAYIWGKPLQDQGQQLAHQQLQMQRSSSGGSETSVVPGLLDQADLGTFPLWLQQQLQTAMESIAAAPASLRLHTAVMMAAAIDDSGAGHNPSSNCKKDEQSAAACEPHDASRAGNLVVQLLSSAASAMQQPGGQPQQHLASSFCQATKAWSSELVAQLATSAHGNTASDLTSLVQLLLGLIDVAGTAAAAVKAVVTACLQQGWDQLHTFAPMLMQAVNSETCTGSCEQDLLASLSACLAAPGLDQQQQQQLRTNAAQQLVQPGIAYLNSLLQQLQSGIPWSTLAPTADSQLCYHLARTRAVLESCLLQQQHYRRQQRQQDREAAGTATAGTSSGEGSGSRWIEQAQIPCRRQPLGPSRFAQQHLDHSASTDVGDIAMTDDVDLTGSCDVQQAPHQASDCGTTAAAAVEQHPAIQLLLQQLWPQLHSIITQQYASGRFLHHYGKCCSRLLKIDPCLLMPQLQQFLQVAAASIARPGGCSLAEPFGTVIELCCRQGSGLLLEGGPLIMQTLSQLWSVPEVLAFTQPGAGDRTPDLAAQVLKLYTAFIKYGMMLLQYSGTGVAVIEQALAAAVTCASCCHKKVSSCALLLLSAMLAAASSEGPQQQVLVQMVCRRGVSVVQGVLGALLAPSPLPRLHKATAALLELATVALLGTEQQQVGGAGQLPQLMHSWFLQASSHLVPGTITHGEATGLATSCSSLFSTNVAAVGQVSGSRQPVSRSYITSRKLKKVLRDFAELHMRASP